jgi:hypothetical protein
VPKFEVVYEIKGSNEDTTKKMEAADTVDVYSKVRGEHDAVVKSIVQLDHLEEPKDEFVMDLQTEATDVRATTKAEDKAIDSKQAHDKPLTAGGDVKAGGPFGGGSDAAPAENLSHIGDVNPSMQQDGPSPKKGPFSGLERDSGDEVDPVD